MGNPHKPGHSDIPGIRPVAPGKGSGYVVDVTYVPTSELLRRARVELAEAQRFTNELWDKVIDMRAALMDIACMARAVDDESIAFVAETTLDNTGQTTLNRAKGDKND
jgi:hypothetical protein